MSWEERLLDPALETMSPSLALGSPVFRTYFWVGLGLLIGAGLIIAVLRWGLRREIAAARASYRGWLVMIPVLLAALFLGRVASICLFTALSLVGFAEYARATGLAERRVMTGVVSTGILAVGITCILTDPLKHLPGWYGLFMALPVYVVAAVLLVPVVQDRARGELHSATHAIAGFVYIGWMFGHLSFLCNSKQAYGYLLFLLFAVEINDVAAFTFGKLFGRHRMRPTLSPGKTWEGAAGALAVSMALPWLLRFSFPDFDTVELLITGLIVGVGGQIGDLAISVIKRDVGVKDMGTLIRGHGGVLDRIDSMIFVAPLFFHATRFLHGFYG